VYRRAQQRTVERNEPVDALRTSLGAQSGGGAKLALKEKNQLLELMWTTGGSNGTSQNIAIAASIGCR